MNPLVVTLQLEPDVQERLDAERRRWFPSGRTQVGAHVTLFHAVPGEREPQVREDLAATAGAPVPIRFTGVVPLGRGAAYALESPELHRRHRRLQRRWWDDLTKQDRQGFRAHVTIANKLDPDAARRVVGALAAAFTPIESTALGFELWRYDGGPWTRLATVPFVA